MVPQAVMRKVAEVISSTTSGNPHEENLLQNDNSPLISRATHAKCAGRVAYFIPGNFEWNYFLSFSYLLLKIVNH